ncbi:MAG: nitrogen regulation protein NR(II) [Pseudomonadota bacterium]
MVDLREWDTVAVLDALGTAVLQLSHDLVVESMNSAAEELLSISMRMAMGQPVIALLGMPDKVVAHLEESAATGQPLTERETPLELRHGGRVIADVRAAPLLDSGVLLEISSLDRQLRIAREDALLAQSESSRLLLRGLAHEVKNPLGGLRGAAQLLERELDEDGLKEYTRIIIDEADRLQRLIDRLSGPADRPNLAPLNLHQVTEYVLPLLESEASEQVEIERDYDPSLPPLNGDREWLVQALLNVGLNALQAIGEAGVLTLRTRVVQNFTIGSSVHRLVGVIQVCDTGSGVPPEIADTLFLPLITGRADGTGLGLPIAQSLIGRHGGLIECHSVPGNTVFSLYLPLESDA